MRGDEAAIGIDDNERRDPIGDHLRTTAGKIKKRANNPMHPEEAVKPAWCEAQKFTWPLCLVSRYRTKEAAIFRPNLPGTDAYARNNLSICTAAKKSYRRERLHSRTQICIGTDAKGPDCTGFGGA